MTVATLADRVYETSLTTGTGALTLAGAGTPRHQTFLAGVGGGNTTFYHATHRARNEWEAGVGVVNLDGTLTRVTVLKNHLGTTAKVNFSAGVKDVIQDIPASKLLVLDADTNALTIPGATKLNGITYTWPAADVANRFLKTDGAGNLSWALPSELLALTDLSDVAIAAPAAGDVLRCSGAAWVNEPATALNTASRVVARDGNGDFAARLITATLVGLAATATALATPRAINGQAFDGTAAITVPVNNTDDVATNATVYPLWTATAGGNYAAKVSTTKLSFNPSTGVVTATGFSGPLTGAVTGNASTATTLQNTRTIWGQNFNGSANVSGALSGATTIDASGVVTLTDVTDATSSLTGAVKTAGGVGIAKALWVGGLANIAGAATLQSTLAVTNTTTLTGNVGVGGAANPTVGFFVQSAAMTGTNQSAVSLQPSFNSASLTSGTVLGAFFTAAAGAYTIASGYGVAIGAPTISNTAVTTIYGVNIANQGQAKSTNAYALYIAAQTGASTINRGIYNGGDSQFVGTISVGGNAPVPQMGLAVSNIGLSGATTQQGIVSNVSYSSGATVAGYGVTSKITTTAAAFTMSVAAAYMAWTPVLGATSAITNTYGLYVQNQGAAGITSAFGVYIEAMSGAGTTNLGLYNLGTSRFDGSIGVGIAPATNLGFRINGTVMTAGTSQYAAYFDPTPTSAATEYGVVSLTMRTAANTTLNAGYSIFVASPSLGATTSIASQYGLLISNQGSASVTNSYGVYIAAQSGAGTTNIGLYNLGTSRFDKPISISAAPASSSVIYIAGVAGLTAGGINGIESSAVLPSSTTDGRALLAQIRTTAAAFTLTSGYGMLVASPSVGAGSAITTMRGIYIANQGAAGVTNAYGVVIDVQSGAGSLNIGLYNAASSNLIGSVAVGGAAIAASTALNLPAATTALSSLRIAHGAAPTAPVDGDMWTTTAGAFIRINGVTKTFTLT